MYGYHVCRGCLRNLPNGDADGAEKLGDLNSWE